MQMMAAKSILLVLGLASASQVTPIQKVLTLMEEMKAKGIKEKEAEAVRFSAFSQWCENTKKSKTDEINAGNQKIESLEAKIEKARVLIEKLTDRILELEEDVSRWKKDEKSAATVRDAERADFTATVTDYTESIDAVAGAINILKKQAYDRKQADLIQSSLIQVRSLKLIPAASKKALTSFLQQAPELEVSAPEANAYEFQSGGVVEMLEKLNDEFSTKKTELEKEELGAQQAFEQIMQQLADNIENAEFEIAKKTKHRAQTAEEKAQLEGDLAQTIQDRDEDQKYLDDTVALCTQKTADFESRQKLRSEELDAISKAIEIIGSQAVAGSGDKHLPALLQIRKKSGALAQLRSSQMSPVQQQVVSFLNEQARKSGSRLLSEMALSAQANPFGKVKKMIKDLIVKLMEEATSETEHKGWCDTELTTNKQTRDKKTSEINELESLIEDLTATIAQLTQDIADLTAAVKELDAAMAKQTEERSDSKAANTQTIKEAKAAQVAVEEAMAVLKDFYAKSAEATAFAQQSPGEDAPETFEKPYQGLLPEGGSVVDFLEVILTDFARLESETASAEAEEEDEYKTFMFESKKDKALKENEIKLKSETKTDKESALQQANEDLKVTQEQLNKALEYYEKLKPTCVDSGITYEERVKRREEEIVSLQEALKILAGTDLPTMG
jgi:chromosome segregation ATPase